MTSATVETKIIGDVDGSQTGDAGDVIWTAFTTNDTSAPASSPLCNLAGRDFLTFQYLRFVGGTGNPSHFDGTATADPHDITIRDCVFSTADSGRKCVQVTNNAGAAMNWLIERCAFFIPGSVAEFNLTRTGADYDANVTVQNCLFLGANNGLYCQGTGAGAGFGGGVKVFNCTMVGANNLGMGSFGSTSTTFPMTVNNCYIAAHQGTGLSAAVSGQVTEDYNFLAASSARSNVTAGANSKTAPNFSALVETGEALLTGRLPRPFLTPLASSPLLGALTTPPAGTPAVDFLNRPRPAGGASTAKAAGYAERHDTGAKEATTVDATAASVRIGGPGDHDLFVPVDAVSTTLTVRGRYDTNHGTTNKPQVLLLANGEIGVTAQTVTMTAAVDTWETLTLGPFTPTAQGFVTLRLVSRAAAGNGNAFFDTIVSTSAVGTGSEDYFRRGEPLPAATTSGTGGGRGGGTMVVMGPNLPPY